MDSKDLFKPRTIADNTKPQSFGKYTPSKQEIYNMRFWKAKKAKRKEVKRETKPRIS